MKNLIDYIKESFLDKDSTVNVVHHILDLMYNLCEDKEKNFGIKFDEVGGNLVNELWKQSKSLVELERNKYIEKTSDGYNVLLTALTKENTVPCKESVPVELHIPNSKIMKSYTDKEIKDAIFSAVEKLKKKIKLY